MIRGCFLTITVLIIASLIGILYFNGQIPIGIYDTIEYSNSNLGFKILQVKDVKKTENTLQGANNVIFAENEYSVPYVQVSVTNNQSENQFNLAVAEMGAKESNLANIPYSTFKIGPIYSTNPNYSGEYKKESFLIFVPNTNRTYFLSCTQNNYSNFCNKIISSFKINTN